MSTLIASQAVSGVQPRGVHVGVNFVYSVYSLTATLADTDIIQMCKIPDGARIIETQLNSGYVGAATVLNVGTRADPDAFIASAGVASAIGNSRINTVKGVGTLLDTSDGASTQYTMVEVQASGLGSTATNTGAISLLVTYSLDQDSI